MVGEYFGAGSAIKRAAKATEESQKTWVSVQKLLDKRRKATSPIVKKSIERQIRKLLEDLGFKKGQPKRRSKIK